MATGLPNCNPYDLEAEEVQVELDVRGVQGRTSGSLFLLNGTMRDEDAGRVRRPTVPHAFPNESVELERCQEIANALVTFMRDVASKPTWATADIVRSRVAHLYHRAQRFGTAYPDNLGVPSLDSAVKTLVLDNIRLREHILSEIGPAPTGAMPKTSTLSTASTQRAMPNLSQPPPCISRATTPRESMDPEPEPKRYSTIPPRTTPTAAMQQSLPQFLPQHSLFHNPDHLFTSNRNSSPPDRSGNACSAWSMPQPAEERRAAPAEREAKPAGQTMSRWAVKFSGGPKDLSADEFVFRVEDMALSSGLRKDDMVCAFHVLLADRAEEWFWGFRRKQRDVNWAQFREAFLHKFASRDTDIEIMSMMAERTQRSGERFDDYCRAVEAMSFRLRNALSEARMVRLLTANADVQLRKVLQMHEVRSVDRLQEVCTEYEDLWIKQGTWRKTQRHVSEIAEIPKHEQPVTARAPVFPSVLLTPTAMQSTDGHQSTFINAASQFDHTPAHLMCPVQQQYVNTDQPQYVQHYHPSTQQQYMPSAFVVPEQHQQQSLSAPDQQQQEYFGAIDAMQTQHRAPEYVCWNCDERGHTYQECEVATRNVFCYGCGAKNIYKKQCQRCAINVKRRSVSGPLSSGNPFQKGPHLQTFPVNQQQQQNQQQQNQHQQNQQWQRRA